MQTVQSANDLVTLKEDIIKGFRWQAERKAKEAAVYFEYAEYAKKAIPTITSFEQIQQDKKLYAFIVAACYLSRKSLGHIDKNAQAEIIKPLIDFGRLADPQYINLLITRYFLTSGDSLGGAMRNIVGQQAQLALTEIIVKHLKSAGIEVVTKANKKNKITDLKWHNRHLFFDRKPKFVGKSIDFILVEDSAQIPSKTLLETEAAYLACGELKGGIDPAGADEHWKTASAALQRIRECFTRLDLAIPKLFFVGAAMEKAMASEIYSDLQSSRLTAAANLLRPPQMEELVTALLAL